MIQQKKSLSRLHGFAQAAGIVLCVLSSTVNGDGAEANENLSQDSLYYPYLEAAPGFKEINVDEFPLARVLLPELVQGKVPDTEFAAIWEGGPFGFVVLFRDSEGEETLVEKRKMEIDWLFLNQMTRTEAPRVVTTSKPLHPEVTMACISAIRRAFSNARPYQFGNILVLDGASYYFFSRHVGGYAHSPDQETEAGTLARLVMALSSFVDGHTDERDLRAAVENALAANHRWQEIDD